MLNIIIPHYNNEDGLFDALRSLENQTKKMFFVTVVDDCSKNKEEAAAIIDKFSDTLKIIYLQNDENRGPGYCRNRGIDLSIEKGFSEIMFLDSDDLLQPRAVEILSRELKGCNEADFITSPILAEKKYGKSAIIPVGENLTWLHGKIYRTAFLEKHNIRFPKNIRYNEDAYFNLVCRFLGNKDEYHLDEVFYIWRDNKNSVTRTNEYDFEEEYGEEYIVCQCEAIRKICSIQEDEQRIAKLLVTLVNIYHAYQKELYFGHDTRRSDIYIISLLWYDKLEKTFTLENLKRYVIPHLKAVITTKKDFIIPHQNFLEWVKLFCSSETYNKISEVLKCQKL